jgi:hypothetical protein
VPLNPPHRRAERMQKHNPTGHVYTTLKPVCNTIPAWSFLLAHFRQADGVEAVPPVRRRHVSIPGRVGFHPDRAEKRAKGKTMTIPGIGKTCA